MGVQTPKGAVVFSGPPPQGEHLHLGCWRTTQSAPQPHVITYPHPCFPSPSLGMNATPHPEASSLFQSSFYTVFLLETKIQEEEEQPAREVLRVKNWASDCCVQRFPFHFTNGYGEAAYMVKTKYTPSSRCSESMGGGAGRIQTDNYSNNENYYSNNENYLRLFEIITQIMRIIRDFIRNWRQRLILS